MTKKTIQFYFAVLLTALSISGCKKQKAEPDGFIAMRLTDLPAIYQQVNVDIVKVRVHSIPNTGSSAWIDLPTRSGIYNLLAIQNGIDTSIVNSTAVPAGKITQMRLVLGSNNTVMADSVVHNLEVPGGSESGVKLNGDIKVVPGQTISVLLDFDAGESVVQTGNGSFQLKPVIKILP